MCYQSDNAAAVEELLIDWLIAWHPTPRKPLRDLPIAKNIKTRKQNRTTMEDITNPNKNKEKGASVMFTKVFRSLENTSKVVAVWIP